MKQTIEIEVPYGKKAVWKDDKIVFEDIKPQLPKTWEEFCKQNKVKIKATEQHLALMQLHQLRDCYRQGWKPNISDDCNKYGIKWNSLSLEEELIVVWCNHDPRFLSFPTYEIAEEFLTNFRELIEQAGDLI